jgi:hypothetical protein
VICAHTKIENFILDNGIALFCESSYYNQWLDMCLTHSVPKNLIWI